MQDDAAVAVRITAAYPESDIGASVWPGVNSLRMSLTESAEQVVQADNLVRDWERRRGIRPGTVALQPAIETAAGVRNAFAIAGSSTRVQALAIRRTYLATSMGIEPGDVAPVRYALAVCELAARAFDIRVIAEAAEDPALPPLCDAADVDATQENMGCSASAARVACALTERNRRAEPAAASAG